MRFFTTFRENRRIKELVNLYRSALRAGASEAEARLAVIEDLVLRSGRLGDQIQHLDITAKRQEKRTLFSPLEVDGYDLLKLIGFIVAWENPSRYNYMPTIDQIRSGDHPREQLEQRVVSIGSQLLAP